MKYRFIAYDRETGERINLYQVVVSRDGGVIGVWSMDGVLYGIHQVKLEVSYFADY